MDADMTTARAWMAKFGVSGKTFDALESAHVGLMQQLVQLLDETEAGGGDAAAQLSALGVSNTTKTRVVACIRMYKYIRGEHDRVAKIWALLPLLLGVDDLDPDAHLQMNEIRDQLLAAVPEMGATLDRIFELRQQHLATTERLKQEQEARTKEQARHRYLSQWMATSQEIAVALAESTVLPDDFDDQFGALLVEADAMKRVLSSARRQLYGGLGP